MWIIRRGTKSDRDSDPIMQMENHFRSSGIGKSKKIYLHLYPFRWDLVNHNRDYRQLVIYRDNLQKTTPPKTCDIIKYHKLRRTLDM